jgi:cytochrome c oxidase assembly protein subunit 15
MAVPDWPNTYGYNLFLFPVAQWVGGILYEHTHRLMASVVGLMTGVLAVWLWWKAPWPGGRWLGIVAFVGVVCQGLLGGLRVVLLKDELGIVHATLGQLFLLLLGIIALLTHPRGWRPRPPASAGLSRLLLLTTGLILGQLILGAAMRHQHAGLAIPDFPTAYGRIWPATDAGAITRYNRERVEDRAWNPVTAAGVRLHMAHRLTALGVVAAVVACVQVTRRRLGAQHTLTRAARGWLGLVLVQVFLGAATVWTGKSVALATAHVAVGSLVLTAGGLLTLVSCQSRGRLVPADIALRTGRVPSPGLTADPVSAASGG